MAQIYFNVFGNGAYWTDANPPMVDGEWFTVRFIPDPDCELLQVNAFDSYDYSIALPPILNNEISMQWRSSWGNMYMDIYFTGSTPPEPPTPTSGKFWLIMAIKKNNERRLQLHVRN